MTTSFPRRFDHIDLRVPSLAVARPFYARLLPALGFTKDVSVDNWLTFEAEVPSGMAEFFGMTELPSHVPNETRIAFWAESPHEVDRLAEVVCQAGGRNIEGPGYDEGPGYYAVFFEDPCGNRLEICHRIPAANTKGDEQAAP
jgi:catechol 2,3-dioxygenase-like lactoylglutathione lyase family enzyme